MITKTFKRIRDKISQKFKRYVHRQIDETFKPINTKIDNLNSSILALHKRVEVIENKLSLKIKGKN